MADVSAPASSIHLTANAVSLDRLEAAATELLAAIRDARGSTLTLPIHELDLLSVSEAAHIACRSPSTIRKWAAEHERTPRGFGRHLGLRWSLSRRRFLLFLQGGWA